MKVEIFSYLEAIFCISCGNAKMRDWIRKETSLTDNRMPLEVAEDEGKRGREGSEGGGEIQSKRTEHVMQIDNDKNRNGL